MNKAPTSKAARKPKKNAQVFILLTVFIYSVGFGIIMPALPNLIIELENVTLSEATYLGGLIGATYALFQFLCGPLMGNLGDRFGRRPIFLFSLFFFGLDFILMGLAPSIIVLFIGRGLAGGLGAVFGPANAAMADLSDEKDRAASFGKVGAAFGIGFIIGPALGGPLGEMWTRLPFFVAGGLALICCIYGYFTFEETMPKKQQRNFEWKRANPLGALLMLGKVPNMLPIAFIYFLWVLAGQIYPSSWSFFAQIQYGWSQSTVGLSLTFVGISMAFVQAILIGRFVSRFGERKTAIFSMFMGLSGFIAYAFIPNGNVAFGLTLLMGLQGMAMPAINAMMSRRVPANQQGELQGFNGSLAALSLLIGQLSFNGLLSHYTRDGLENPFPGAPFLLAAVIALLAIIAIFMLPKAKPETAKIHHR